MGKKVRKTLYFINGVAPTHDQQEEAEGIRGQVCFRNATMIRSDEKLEDFDAVAGDVPAQYQAEADRRAAEAEGLPPVPLANPQAPAAPQKAAGATAKPTGGAGTAWKAN